MMRTLKGNNLQSVIGVFKRFGHFEHQMLLFGEPWPRERQYTSFESLGHADPMVYVVNCSVFLGNKECPTCRKKLVSRRSLRPDPNFDALLSKIFPDRAEYEDQQQKVNPANNMSLCSTNE